MTSEVAIANRALSKLGDDRILLLTDDVKAARTLRDMFDPVRDAELRRMRWKFAMVRTSLPALVATPAWGYTKQYTLPADYLAMVQINDYHVQLRSKVRPPYSIENGFILTDYEAPLKIRYISRIENTSLYDPLFVEVLACKLAMEACETLTQSETKFTRCADQYKWALTEAVRQDAIEMAPEEFPDGSWLDVRQSDERYEAGVSGWQSYPSGF